MHPNTAQLPVAVRGQPRRTLPLAMMFIGLAALGAGITVAMLALKAPTPAVAPVRPVAPPPPQPSQPTTAAANGAEQPTPVAVVPPPVPAPEPLPVAPVRPTSMKARPVAAPRAECVADLRWRKAAQVDLGQHRVLAARLGPEPFRRFEVAEDAILEKLEALPMDADCAELDAAIDRLLASVK